MIKSLKASFICIGGQRCGKNTMYSWLREHPDVSTSHEMEVNFFNRNWEKGYEWYENNFEHRLGAKTKGEMSSYLYDIQAAERVYKYNKDIKIIISLRNPVKRLVSHYKHLIKTGHMSLDNIGINNAIKRNPSLIELSRYSKYLTYWFDQFPSKNILVINFDSIVKRPDETYTKLCNFLEIDSSHKPKNLGKKQNSSYIPKSQLLLKFITKIRLFLEFIGLKSLVRIIRSMQITKIIDYFNDSKIGIDLKENDLAFLEGNLENEWKKIEGLIQEKNPANIGM